MNTITDLIKYGITGSTADKMLESYKKRIGDTYGCNKITDIIYVGDGKRDVELTCTLCGNKTHRIVNNTSSKWSELRKTCSKCQASTLSESAKNGVARNDDPDYIGKVYGDFKVVGFEYRPHRNGGGNTILWSCECIHCGELFNGKMPSVIRKGTRCQCQIEAEKKAAEAKREAERKQRWDSEIGKKYGRLTVVGIEHKFSGKTKKAYAICNCDCGGHITVQYGNLKYGKTKSCGCIAEEYVARAKDGREVARSRSVLYGTWSGMNARCFNANNKAYKDYGGRGITICDEWLGPKGFDRFEEWSFQNGYTPDAGLSLDRIDVNGNYCPENCRYTTIYVQTVNQRPRRRQEIAKYVVDGEEKTLNQWCSEYHISPTAVRYRMDTLHMSFEKAIKTPKTRKGNKFAGQLALKRTKEENINLNKCNSYIEANLYLASVRQHSFVLVSQYQVGNYRTDFWVEGTDYVVECDGYDIHKTKEQIRDDYTRERYLMKCGYKIIRFSGTEINDDPDACCREIAEIIGEPACASDDRPRTRKSRL